jgi:MerR family transcriptional regulator, light-induced transcriptional regulator
MMTTIEDFPDDPKYTIKSVSAQTGIRPVTLRAWERRYELLSPHRSDNHYRLYSERDVAILVWIKSQVDGNVPISQAVANLRQRTEVGNWPESLQFAPSFKVDIPVVPIAQLVNDLYGAFLKHREDQAGDLLRQAQQMYELPQFLFDVVSPVLVKIGEAWYNGEINIATEHFASAYIRGKLLSVLQSYPVRRNSGYILIGGAPTEMHEISGIMMSIMLRSQGYRVEYLGPDVPLDDLVDYASYEHPDLIILTAMMEPAALELRTMSEKLAKLRKTPIFGYGGRAFLVKPELQKRVAGVFLGKSMAEGLEIVNSLMNQPLKVGGKTSGS